jgi:cyclomaltodextrinase / maltogenic alpha-amylase / neopullulanase
MKHRYSRRDFLRFSGTTLVAASLKFPAQAQEAGMIRLHGGDSDVWAWRRQVSGQVSGCDAVTVDVNGVGVPASVEGETFSAEVPIAEGENAISASCADDASLISESLTYTGRLRDVPIAQITINIEGDVIRLDASGSTPSENSSAAITDYQWRFSDENPEPVARESAPIGNVELSFDAPTADGEYYISLTVTDANGKTDTAETYFVVEQGQPRIPNYDTENPAWVENTVVYGVIPRNFGSPGFQAIIDRLGYLSELGINAMWLAPINVSPPGDYGYAVVDYFDVSTRNGTKEDFRRLVQEAHASGIRVLMDFVPNHSSEHHPYFEDALRHGQESPYWNFYDRDESGMYTYYFDWTHLPNLNFENPEVRRWMLEAFSYWVREFDVDGFRVDVAWGIRERRPEFWMEWRHELKRIKPDLLLLAEASARDEFYFTEGFDAAYDWTGQLGHWAWELVWEDRNLLTFNLNAALTNLRNGFHPDALIFRFLNNNDTGARFVSKYGPEMTRVATALLLTLPGIPCIYTGDEVGAQFTPYGDPGAISWEDRLGLYDYHKRLIALRREMPALHSRNMLILNVEPRQQVYGYARYARFPNSEVQWALVLLNFTDEAVDAAFEVPEEVATQATRFTDLLTGETFESLGGDGLTIRVPPMRALILG